MPARYTTPYAMKAGRPKSSAIQLEATRLSMKRTWWSRLAVSGAASSTFTSGAP